MINLIIINFGNREQSIAEWQRASWIGGKKNDLVLCYAGDSNKPKWVKVFGWTDSEIVKTELETLLMKGVNESIIPKIKECIIKNYVIKDWSKFDYLTVEIPFSKYMWLIGLQILFCGGWILFAILNNGPDVTFSSNYRKYYGNRFRY